MVQRSSCWSFLSPGQEKLLCLSDLLLPSYPPCTRQEGVKSSLFEIPGWGRAHHRPLNHKPPQFSFPKAPSQAPATQSSCAPTLRTVSQTCRLTNGAKPAMSWSSTRAWCRGGSTSMSTPRFRKRLRLGSATWWQCRTLSDRSNGQYSAKVLREGQDGAKCAGGQPSKPGSSNV